MEFQEFIKPELLILIPVLYLIGIAIKKSKIEDRHIPWILGVISIVLVVLYLLTQETIEGGNAVATLLFTAFTQGVLLAGAAVYTNQIYKQANKEE